MAGHFAEDYKKRKRRKDKQDKKNIQKGQTCNRSMVFLFGLQNERLFIPANLRLGFFFLLSWPALRMNKEKGIMSRRERRDVGCCIGVEMEYNSHDYFILRVYELSDRCEIATQYDDIVLLVRRLARPVGYGSSSQHGCYSHALLSGHQHVLCLYAQIE